MGGAARQVPQNYRSRSPVTEDRQERPSRNSEHSTAATSLDQEKSHLHGNDLLLSTDVLPDDLPAGDGDTDGATEAPPGGGKLAATVPLSADAARVPLVQALMYIVGELSLRWHTAGDLDACAGERTPYDWCVMLPVSQRVQPGVYTMMAPSRYRDALVQSRGPERPLVYQPLIPHILTASYHCILLPPRAFNAHLPVTRDVFYAVALFLQLRTHYPELIEQHRGADSLLLTPRLDTQATFAKLFADIGRDGDVRYVQLEELLKHGLPPPSAVNFRHVQACGPTCAETLSHAAELTSHTNILMYGKSGFLGIKKAGYGRSTVGLTRARGPTFIIKPPDSYGLIELVQTVLVHHYAMSCTVLIGCFRMHFCHSRLHYRTLPLWCVRF